MVYKIQSATCPKCGNEVKGVEYVQCGDMEIDAEKSRHSGELKRCCGGCGYVWYENSLDNKKNA